MPKKESNAIILVIIMSIATAIIISRMLFPIFLILTIFVIIIFVIIFLYELSNNNLDLSKWFGLAVIVFISLTSITWFIGYGIGGTSFGEASLEIYYGITGAEQEINKELQATMNLLIENSCKTLSEENCSLLKTTAKTAKTLEEISSMAKKLESTQKIVNIN